MILELASYKIVCIATHMETFEELCQKGKLQEAKEMYLFKGMDIIEKYPNALYESCVNGHIDVAMWLYPICAMDHNINMIFQQTCGMGHIDLVKWLYSCEVIDINADDDLAFQLSCRGGRLDIAKWLYTLGDIDIYANDNHAFISSCHHNRIQTAKWLYIIHICKNKYDQQGLDLHDAFMVSCMRGHVDLVNWFHSLKQINIHAHDDNAFHMACRAGKIKIAQLLYSYGGVNIHSHNNMAFRKSYANRHQDVAKWLISIGIVPEKDHALYEYYQSYRPMIFKLIMLLMFVKYARRVCITGKMKIIV